MSFTDLLALLVVRHKVMRLSEFYAADAIDLDVLITHLEEVERDAMERTRLMVWAALAPNSKTKLKPDDVITFSWEKHRNDPQPVTTKEQFEEIFKNFKKA